MSRFNKFIEACDGSGKKKHKRKGKDKDIMDEGTISKRMYNGVHVKDSILDGITLEELQDTIFSNLPKNKINSNAVQKEFNSMINANMKDAKFTLKKVMKELVEDLTMEGDE